MTLAFRQPPLSVWQQFPFFRGKKQGYFVFLCSKLIVVLKATFIYLLVVIVFYQNGFAQRSGSGSFSLIGIRQGLSNNQVNDVLQDSFGFLWIATKKGLNRYDGKNFIQFYADSGSNSLPTDELTKMKLLPGDQLAVYTASGLFIINTKTLATKTIIIPADSLVHDYKVNVLMDVEADSKGNIYLVTRSGFYVVDKNEKIIFRYDHYSSKEALTKTFAFGFSVISMNETKYLLCTEKGPWIYDSERKNISPLSANVNQAFHGMQKLPFLFRSRYKDKHGFMALAYYNMIMYYDMDQQKVQDLNIPAAYHDQFDYRSRVDKLNDTTYSICGKENGFYFIYYRPKENSFVFDPGIQFPEFNCRKLLKDHAGRLWVATSKGLFREKQNGTVPEILTVPKEVFHDSTDIIFRVVKIVDDKIYAGSKEGLFVLNRYNGKVLKRYDFSAFSSTSKNIFSLLLPGKDSLLIGPNSAPIVFNLRTNDHKELKLPGWDSTNWVPAMHLDKKGNLFIATNDYGSFYLRSAGQSFSTPLRFNDNMVNRILSTKDIVSDHEGNAWFCGHGVSRYNMASKTFDLSIDSFPRMKTGRKEVSTLTFDKAGNIYLALVEGGLVIYDRATKKFEQFGRSNGLPDNQVNALYLLNNILWVGTASGIASFNIATKEIFSYGNMDDGQPETYFTGFSFFYDSIRQQMYAPCNNSIIRFDPFAFKRRTSTPVFFVENIRVSDREIIYHPGEKIVLGSGKKNLVVNIASINFEDALQELLFYRFKNRGDWQPVGNQRSLVLSNLSDGDHELEFMLSSKNNSWKAITRSLHIYIRPPFYKTTWFIVVAAVVLLSALWLLYRIRIQRIKQKANIDNQLAELEMKSLHAQMNPHFIFNALNSIKEMIWENDKQNASRYLSKFAQLIRTTLEQSRLNFITVKQCVQHLEQYLEMEKIRFEDFSYHIDTDKELEWDQVRMAPMLVQPLVENAIWHGLKNIDGKKILGIKFYRRKDHVVCEIEDNGPGIYHQPKPAKPNGRHRSISIENIRSRLQMLNEKYNMNCSLEFIDKADTQPGTHGTIAILSLSV